MFFDQRKHERKDIVKIVEYVLEGFHVSEAFEGIIANVSDSGFCLLTTNPLDNGTKIAIKNQMQFNSQSAAVRWSTKTHNLYYKVGLEIL
jgi:hypothetical protein